ncbi:MAG: hypothetical protein IJS97_07795 [Prevotella sp.]|nr:hypothetical protein [Prevotella sp.]
MKRVYLKPNIRSKSVLAEQLLGSNSVNKVNSNADLNYGGGGNEVARGRTSVWSDGEEE